MDEFNKNNFEELSINDNICINGGGFISIIVAIGGVYFTCDAIYQGYKGFKAGWKAGAK